MGRSMDKQRYLVVSIHDVSPAFTSELKEMVDELDSAGVSPRSILVVPNYQECHNIGKDDEFLNWIHSLQEQGDEIVHHGYTHLAGESHHSSPRYYLYERLFAKGCGEFQYLGYREAIQKITSGEEILHRGGMHCQGFVAPGWLMSRETARALLAKHYSYATATRQFKDYETGLNVESEVVRFVPKPRFQDYLYRQYDLYLVRIRQKKRRLARIALHPLDMRFGKPFGFALKIIRHLRNERILATYLDFARTLTSS